jgi:hypothetical protein
MCWYGASLRARRRITGSGVQRTARPTKSATFRVPNKGNTHPIPLRGAFYTRMKKNGEFSHGRRVMDYALAAAEQMELYYEAHPVSPAAVRRPRLFVRGELWIALLGPNVEEGIVGIGPTVTAALRAFDTRYLAGLRTPAETIGSYRTVRKASSAVA